MGVPRRRRGCLHLSANLKSMIPPRVWRRACFQSQISLHLFCCYSEPMATNTPSNSWIRGRVPQSFRNLKGHNREEWHRRCCNTHWLSTWMSLDLDVMRSTCCVPDLQFNLICSNFDSSKLEVDSDSGEQMFIELAVDELTEEGRLSCVSIELPTAESPTSTNLYSPATTGIISIEL